MEDIEPRRKILFYDLMKRYLDLGLPGILLTLEGEDMVADIFPIEEKDLVAAIKEVADEFICARKISSRED